jgi:hypothetical protein
MNRDIRIATNYPDHPKIRKLKKLLGAEGVISHIFLLCFAGRICPSGKLEDMDSEDIASVAQWRGQPEQFVDTLMELRLLDKVGDTYSIHNWQKHNYFAMQAEARSRVARQNINRRWRKKNKKALEEIKENQDFNTIRNTDANSDSNTPSPSPSPSRDGMDGGEVDGSECALGEHSSPSPFTENEVINLAEKVMEKYDYPEALADVDYFQEKGVGLDVLIQVLSTIDLYHDPDSYKSVRRCLFDRVNERTGYMFGFQ